MTRLLATPIRIGRLVLPNRIIMGSMHLGFETEPDAAQRLARFYGERAAGGVGLIVTGGVAPNAQGRFGADGTGQWIALAPSTIGVNGVALRDNPNFAGANDAEVQAKILIKTRMADMAAFRAFAGSVLWQLPGVRETRTYAVMEEVKNSSRLPL